MKRELVNYLTYDDRMVNLELVNKIVKEVLIQIIYEEMYPLKEPITAEEMNNRKERAIDEYLGKNLGKDGFPKPPLLYHKVQRAYYYFRETLNEREEIK